MAQRKVFTPSEREQHQVERNAKLQRARALLEEGIAKLQTSDDWRRMLEQVAKNLRTKLGAGRFSFRNQLLLAMQVGSGEIGPIATFETWKRVGRHVKKGEKAVFVLQPRPIRPRDKATGKTVNPDDDPSGEVMMAFRPLALFRLLATEGPPLEELPRLTGDITAPEPFDRAVETLRDVVLRLDGTPVASVDIRPREADDHPTAFGWYVRSTKAIAVVDTGNRAQMLRTLAHETAHAILHGAGDHHDLPTKEVEAESVSYIVSHAIGLDVAAYSFPYVASWAPREDAAQRVRESGERIHLAARVILDALLGPIEDVDTETTAQPLCA
jgi:hypothetical protein